MNVLSEADRRKPEFRANSIPVTIADRGEWFIPRPSIVVRPAFEAGVMRGVTTRYSLGPEFDALVKQVAKTEDAFEKVERLLYLAAHMVALNYELASDELEDLLTYRVGSEADQAWVLDIAKIALSGSAIPSQFQADDQAVTDGQ